MNKTQIIENYAHTRGISKKEATKQVDTLLALFASAVRDEGELTIPAFGRFSIRTVPEHKKLIPGTKDITIVRERKKVSFKPYRAFLFYASRI